MMTLCDEGCGSALGQSVVNVRRFIGEMPFLIGACPRELNLRLP